MGICPCPRCLIPKGRAHLLGTTDDRNQRRDLARVGDQHYRAKITDARKIIYQNNRTVDSVMVQRLLKPESLVPTEVFISFIYTVFVSSIFAI